MQAGDEKARALLEAVRGLGAPEEQTLLSAQSSQAQSEARDLLALERWDTQARERAAVLGLLTELVMLPDHTAAQVALMQQWSQAWRPCRPWRSRHNSCQCLLLQRPRA